MIKYVTLLTGLSISIIAAWYSIVGLTAIFPASMLAIILMGSGLEIGKVVAVSWLYHNWSKCSFWLKGYLIPAIGVLMVITSIGIFGFLSKAHIDQQLDAGTVQLQIDQLDRQIQAREKIIADNQLIIDQFDETVQTLIDFDRIRGADGAIAVRESQAVERGRLALHIQQLEDQIIELQTTKQDLLTQQLEFQSEIGPIKYVSEMFFDLPTQIEYDKSVRILILIIMFVFDPLAIILLIAANNSFKQKSVESIEQIKEDDKIVITNKEVVQPWTIDWNAVKQYATNSNPTITEKIKTKKQRLDEAGVK